MRVETNTKPLGRPLPLTAAAVALTLASGTAPRASTPGGGRDPAGVATAGVGGVGASVGVVQLRRCRLAGRLLGVALESRASRQGRCGDEDRGRRGDRCRLEDLGVAAGRLREPVPGGAGTAPGGGPGGVAGGGVAVDLPLTPDGHARMGGVTSTCHRSPTARESGARPRVAVLGDSLLGIAQRPVTTTPATRRATWRACSTPTTSWPRSRDRADAAGPPGRDGPGHGRQLPARRVPGPGRARGGRCGERVGRQRRRPAWRSSPRAR